MGEQINQWGRLVTLVKTQPQTANIPIILVTAYALVNEQHYLLETSKADSFYAKPILDFDLLLKGLTQLVKKIQRNHLELITYFLVRRLGLFDRRIDKCIMLLS